MNPHSAMIFAAGFGTRMKELTRHQPKALVKVNDRTLIDRALQITEAAQIKNRVVNAHYLADQLASHLQDVANLQMSFEWPMPLETGGGLKRALPLLGPDPVFTINPDVIWTGANPLLQLQSHWRPDEMDALLMLIPVESAIGHHGDGDFSLDSQGRLLRAGPGTGPRYIYSGAEIVRTDLLVDITEPVFSLNVLWDQMSISGNLCGCVFDGQWVDVGSAEGITNAEIHLQKTGNV